MSQRRIQDLSKLAALFVNARDVWRNLYSRTERNINTNNLDEIGVQNVCSMIKATKGINEIYNDMLEDVLNICLEMGQQFKERRNNGAASNDEEEENDDDQKGVEQNDVDHRAENMEVDESESIAGSESEASDHKPNGKNHAEDSSEKSDSSDTGSEDEREETGEQNKTPKLESVKTSSQDSAEGVNENNVEIEANGEEREIAQTQTNENTEEIETGEVHSDMENDNDQIAQQKTQVVNGHENENEGSDENDVIEVPEFDETNERSDQAQNLPNGDTVLMQEDARHESHEAAIKNILESKSLNESPNESTENLSELEPEESAGQMTNGIRVTEQIGDGSGHESTEIENSNCSELSHGEENAAKSNTSQVLDDDSEIEDNSDHASPSVQNSNDGEGKIESETMNKSQKPMHRNGVGDFDEGKENDGYSANVYINPESERNIKIVEHMITTLETPQESIDDVIMEESPANSQAEASSSGQSTPSPNAVLKSPLQQLTENDKNSLQSSKKLSVRLEKIDPTKYMIQISSSPAKTQRKRGRSSTPKTSKISTKKRTRSESSDDFEETPPKQLTKFPSKSTSSKGLSKDDYGIKMEKKRRLSVSATSSQPIPTNYATPSTSTDKRSQRERAGMKKRHSGLRKTIHDLGDLENQDEMPPDSREKLKNTNKQMHSSNDLYEKLCVLCDGNYRFLVTHYAKEHSDREVFISRPSPEMVDIIKQQKRDEFEYDESSKKITGMCYFCKKEKSFQKSSWQRHLLTHTGEQMYFCVGCNTEGGKKGKHNDCDSMYVNIYEMGDNDDKDSNEEPATKKDYPLRCYICNHCNYTQINDIPVKNHLILEHTDLKIDDLSKEYKSFVLVPHLKE